VFGHDIVLQVGSIWMFQQKEIKWSRSYYCKQYTPFNPSLIRIVLIIVIKMAWELTLTFYLCLYMKAVVTEQGIRKKITIILFPSLRFACFSQFFVLFHSHSSLLAILFLKSIVPILSGIKGSIFRL
jgi:hypothetical protein